MEAKPLPALRRRSVRHVLLACGSAAMAVALAACGSSSSGSSASVGTLPKDLKILTVYGPSVFDQWQGLGQPMGVIELVNEPLIRYDGSKFIPDLATSFKTVSPVKYTYTMRTGVKFSDGTPLTADDIKYSLETAAETDSSRESTTYVVMSSIKDVKVAGTTITVDLKAPNPQFQYVLAQTGIVSKAFYQKYGKKVGTPAVGQLGTGPYLLKTFKPDDESVIARNPKYWGDPAPFNSITFTVAKDDSARMLALQSGDADGIFEMPISQVNPVDQLPDYKTYAVKDTTLYILQMDVTKKPFDDPKVRDAVRHAVNRQGVIDAVFGGHGEIASTLTSAATLEKVADKSAVEKALAGFDEDNKYDVDQAKADIAASSVPNGFSVEIPVESDDPNMSLIGQDVAQDLSKIGIKATIKIHGDDYINVLLKHQENGLTLNSFSTNDPDPVMPMGYFTTADGIFNLTGLKNADAVAKMNQSNRLAVDSPQRGQLLLDALSDQQDSGAILPIAFPGMFFAFKNGLSPDGFTNYWWMSRWDEDVKAGTS